MVNPYVKFLIPLVVGVASFYVLYVLQGSTAALILVTQNLFTFTLLFVLIDYIKNPEKVVKHINHLARRRKKRIDKAKLDKLLRKQLSKTSK